MRTIEDMQEGKAVTSGGNQTCDRAVDAWVRRSLAATYRTVLSEQLPAELVSLAIQLGENVGR